MDGDRFIELLSSLLGKGNERLRVLYSGDGVLALEKPFGVLIDAYPWYPEVGSMVAALKRGLTGSQFDALYSIYSLEPEVTGVALFATNKEIAAYLRNELGSGKFVFRFLLIAESELKEGTVECDLPLAKHYTEDTVVVSNKTGKKSRTVFNLVARTGAYQLWEAKTDYVRMHQIRVHAMERGIRIVGEELYRESASPKSVAFRGNVGKGLERKLVICEGLCLHLSAVEWEQGGARVVVESPLPQRIKEVFKHLNL